MEYALTAGVTEKFPRVSVLHNIGEGVKAVCTVDGKDCLAPKIDTHDVSLITQADGTRSANRLLTAFCKEGCKACPRNN